MKEPSCLTVPSVLLLFLGLILVAVEADTNSNSISNSNSTPIADLTEEFKRLQDLVEDLRQEVNRQREENANLTRELVPDKWIIEPLTGPPGSKGEKGDVGLPGENGEEGHPGLKGSSGAKGEPGLSGRKGVPGEKGEKGERGFAGPKGAKGTRGSVGPEFPPFCSTAHLRFRVSSSKNLIRYPRQGQYAQNLDLCYMLTPPPGESACVTVRRVETELKWDYLEIYKSDSGVFTSLEKLTGDMGPLLQRIHSSKIDEPLLLYFHSDATTTQGKENGISFSFYTSSSTEVEPQDDAQDPRYARWWSG